MTQRGRRLPSKEWLQSKSSYSVTEAHNSHRPTTQRRTGSRAVMATYTVEKQHVTLTELQKQTYNQYLEKLSSEHRYNIPAYPRPELHVTHVSHSTDLNGLQGIRADGGFRDPYNREQKDFLVAWFSLTVTPEDLSDAETRDIKIVQPSGGEEGAGGATRPGAGLLAPFASSPAFLSSSRYGSYRLTFDLMDVLDRYSEQFCGGWRPVMRTWKTELYRQEVLYAVLVHSPHHNNRFSHFPLLEETPHSICAFRDELIPYFLWRPQAMSETHRFELLDSGDTVSVPDEFFVWDHVALALVVDDQVLHFTEKKLRTSLRFCEEDYPKVNQNIMFESHDDANRAVQDLWPGSGDLEKFDESPLHISTS
ncbi:uncharacterized protein LOC129456800 [Periophthalmus magnuspinnatus]|uniref:uncharacterized protein LOC129456800 n=1 Tax=Periophthalmus magnuspinnatus TaxID=409849 RepID=UPI002436BA91|nr:uncharacterized protein LOC129456800 [Periophthalmus magnuspinnatus]